LYSLSHIFYLIIFISRASKSERMHHLLYLRSSFGQKTSSEMELFPSGYRGWLARRGK
jgi:hypothetical protein